MSAYSAVLSKNKSNLRIPKITPPGELLFFVDVAQITSHTPEKIQEMAIAHGYEPELRIAEYYRDGEKTLEPVLLLYQGSDSSRADTLLEHWEELAALVKPSSAVHLRSGSNPPSSGPSTSGKSISVSNVTDVSVPNTQEWLDSRDSYKIHGPYKFTE